MAVKSITPFLWFNTEAEDAAKFYVSLFENSRIIRVSRYPEGTPMPKGSVMVVAFELQGQRITALNGGPNFKLDEAFSLTVDCTEQADIDRLWQALGEGGSYSACGWLKDRFGLSWQVNWSGMADLFVGNPATAQQVMNAMMKMAKIDIQKLKDAAAA